MKFKIHFTIIFLFSLLQAKGMQSVDQPDSLTFYKQQALDPDSLLDSFASNSTVLPKVAPTVIKTPTQQKGHRTRIRFVENDSENQAFDSLLVERKKSANIPESGMNLPSTIKPMRIDSLVLRANPFFIELVYENIPLNFNWGLETDFRKIYYGKRATSLTQNAFVPIQIQKPEQFIYDLRSTARTEITRKSAHLYAFTFDELPDPNGNKNHFIEGRSNNKIKFVDDDEVLNTENRRMYVKKIIVSPWSHKASTMAQFSQNYVSSNWYQGGNSNVAVLGILSGQLNYDDKKCIQWENNSEWRMGFNSVTGDSLRMLSTNDDVMKINSKLGVKAGGNWFYSGSVDFSTQLFNSYKGINSTVKKTSFLTPIRLNIGVGLDYKYKKLFSLMLSPVAFKYIYLENKLVDPRLFGIKTGESSLSELGSSFRAVFSYAPSREIQLDSKLSFYTNYKKVEIDWEMVCNFTINRFLSTRISFNPRYDNTVIEKPGDKAGIQFKQLMSIGFSHKFR